MTTKSVLSRFEEVAARWLEAIDEYNEEEFGKKPDEDSWSIGQVYEHLTEGTREFPLERLTQCLDGQGVEMEGGMKTAGRLIFLAGSFPPIRVKVVDAEKYTPVQPDNIASVVTGLRTLIDDMRNLESRVAAASETQKTEHPALGYLNARQWYQLIEMHFRHHLRQKKRIDDCLGKES